MRDLPAIARLITYTDLTDWPDLIDGPGQPAGQASYSAILKAELVNGHQHVLLDDRGWSESCPSRAQAARRTREAA